MRYTIVTFLALLTCAGCAQRPWISDDPAQFRRDNYACSLDSRTMYGGSGLLLAISALSAKQQGDRIYKDCMESKGYRQATD